VPAHFQQFGARAPQWTQLIAADGVLPRQLGQAMTDMGLTPDDEAGVQAGSLLRMARPERSVKQRVLEVHWK
jgi:hypothetical protein